MQEESEEAGRPEHPDGGVHLLELLRDHLEGGGSSRQVETGSFSTDPVPSGGSTEEGTSEE